MSWEISAALSQSIPPYQLFSASSPNVNSWSQEVLTLPDGDELGFRQRMILSISCRAVSGLQTAQLDPTERIASFCFLSRLGRPVTPHVMAVIYQHNSGLASADSENFPIFQWMSPFFLPARGGDSLTVLVPGDADASPTQDWELNVMMGRELR